MSWLPPDGAVQYLTLVYVGRLISDCTVEKIWEGTTNVLALDVVRVILKSRGRAVEEFIKVHLSHHHLNPLLILSHSVGTLRHLYRLRAQC